MWKTEYAFCPNAELDFPRHGGIETTHSEEWLSHMLNEAQWNNIFVWKLRDANIKLIQEILGENLCDFGVRNDFLINIQKMSARWRLN